MNKFEESKHPRDELGQFAEKDSPIMQKQGLYDGAGSESDRPSISPVMLPKQEYAIMCSAIIMHPKSM